jgi:hypothetical protein
MAKRLGFNPVAWHELAESRAATAAKRCAEEGAALLKLARDADAIVALDERGKALTSQAFAQLLGQDPRRRRRHRGHPDWRRRRPCPRRPRGGADHAVVRRHHAAAWARPASCWPSSSTAPLPSWPAIPIIAAEPTRLCYAGLSV